MKRLDVTLHLRGNVIYGWVNRQDDNLRCRSSTKVLARKGVYRILTANTPQLSEESFYVCGNHPDRDKDFISCKYRSVDAAMKAMSAFTEMIEQINNDPNLTAREAETE